MPNERATVFEISRLAPEVTPRPGLAVTRQLQGLSIMPGIKTKTTPFVPQGYKYNTTLSVDQEWTEATLSGLADYDDLIYPLSGLFGAPTPTTPAGGTLTRDWLWNPSTFNPETAQTFTVEAGSSVRAGKFSYGVVDSYGVTYTRDTITGSGTMFGQRYQDGITMTAPPSEVQTLTMTGTPTGGTVTLVFDGQTTATIAFNAASSAVQTALRALGTIGATGVTVSGGAWPGSAMVVTFAGPLAGQRVPLITLGTNALTGGSSPTVTVAETTPGGMEVVAQPIFPTQHTIYVDTTAAGLGTTALTRPFSFSWMLTGKWGQVWPINAANTSFATHVELKPKMAMKIKLEADAAGMTYLTQFRAGTSLFIRVGAVGAIIEGSLAYTHNADFCCKITGISPFADEKGVWAIEYDLENFQDVTWGQSMGFFCRNTLTAL